MAPRSKLTLFAFMCIAGAAGLAAAALWRHSGAPPANATAVEHANGPELVTGSYISPPRALADFSLIDHHGRTFDNSNLRGGWSLLFFGYTNCPEFCPSTLTMLAAVEKRLRAAGAAVRPRVIFMSVDAERDTPAQLAAYVPNFDPEFIGLTAADQPRIAAVAAKLGVAVTLTPKADGTYTVDHSGVIFVLNPEGRMTAILSGPFSVDALLADFKRIVAEHG